MSMHARAPQPLAPRIAYVVAALLLAVAAFLFHLPKLDARPMHTDEAVHAVKLGILLESGEYTYNPHEYHGPVIYYAALPFVKYTGARTLADIPAEWPLRLPIVICGALLVALVAASGHGLGRAAALYAALLVAVSPAFSFYSRYYIQEVPFVLFCYGSMASAWCLLKTLHWRWAIITALMAGLAIALKETWIMIAGTAALTVALLHMTSARHPWPMPFPWRRFAWLFPATIAASLAVGLILLSNLLRNPAALRDAALAMAGYMMRGVSGDSSTFGANIHDHPWSYYLRLLTWPEVDGPWYWSEGITLLLGLIGMISIIRNWLAVKGQWHYTLVITILLTAFFSAIPYKTPWNVLPMLLGWILLAGRGAACLALAHRSKIFRTIAIALLLAWSALLAVQTWRATIKRPADARNPYAYSPTSTSMFDLATRANDIAAVSPAGRNLTIHVYSPTNDYWPLPWYLRRFPHIGYFTRADELNPGADLIIATSPLSDPQSQALGPRQAEYYGLRPDVPITMHISQPLWQAFMAIR